MALTSYEYYTGTSVQAGLSAKTCNSTLTLNKKNITLYSGSMHYFRVPRQYWRDRLRKMRAAGLNTVDTFIPWNLHEPQPGVYDFGSGGTDFQDLLHIEQFLKIAKEEDLFAIVRPGPYIGSEWEFGGMPSWLLRDPNMIVRSSYEGFTSAVKRYFSVLLPLLAALQFTKGGPIIAMQIEHEYGRLKKQDLEYLKFLKREVNNCGIEEFLLTSDSPIVGRYVQLAGVFYAGNFGSDAEKNFNIMEFYQPEKPLLVMEYYCGWFDYWMEEHSTELSKDLNETLVTIFSQSASINFHMFHGGTTFGFMNGANSEDNSTDNAGFQPSTNSYDYDAPLNEIGDPTEKYYFIKKLIKKYNKVVTVLPRLPVEMPRTTYQTIKVKKQLTLNQLLTQKLLYIFSNSTVPMELLPIRNSGQSYGYITYRAHLKHIPPQSHLKIEGRVCDTAMVLINSKLVSKVLEQSDDLSEFGNWKAKDATLYLGEDAYNNATLDIVVENWGRIYYGSLDQFVQYKGLWQGQVYLNNKLISPWQVFPLEFKRNWTQKLTGWTDVNENVGPTLYKVVLNVKRKPEDTFIDMSDWKKGFIVVNGFVLSRYFHLGPQQTAYLPGAFLKTGDNEILIFEHFVSPGEVQFSSKAIYFTKML